MLQRLEETLAAGDDTYLDAVITETLRLRPTVPFTVRAVNRDVVLNDVYLPRGSMVFLYINGIHRRGDLYDAPDEFRPERFLEQPPTLTTGCRSAAASIVAWAGTWRCSKRGFCCARSCRR